MSYCDRRENKTQSRTVKSQLGQGRQFTMQSCDILSTVTAKPASCPSTCRASPHFCLQNSLTPGKPSFPVSQHTGRPRVSPQRLCSGERRSCSHQREHTVVLHRYFCRVGEYSSLFRVSGNSYEVCWTEVRHGY